MFGALPPTRFAVALAATLIVACSESSRPTVDVPIGPGSGNREPLEGKLALLVVDADQQPIPEAQVVVQAGGQLWEDRTDEAGRLELRGAGLRDTADVHVRSGEVGQSQLDIQASSLTITLDDPSPPGPSSMQVGTVEGTLTGLELLPSASAGQARVAEVLPFGHVELGAPSQRARPGSATPDDPDGFPHNLVVEGPAPFPTWTSYRLAFDQRAVGVMAVGWLFDEAQPQAATPRALGFTLDRPVDGSSANIELTHPMDVELSVRTRASELAVRQARFSVALTPEGASLPLDYGALGTDHARRARAPALEGTLARAMYRTELWLRTDENVGAHPARWVEAVRESTEANLDLSDVLAPPAPSALAGRTVAVVTPVGADIVSVRLLDADGRTRWTLWLNDPDRREVSLPDEMGEAWPRGQVDLVTSAFDLGDEGVRSTSHAAARIVR